MPTVDLGVSQLRRTIVRHQHLLQGSTSTSWKVARLPSTSVPSLSGVCGSAKHSPTTWRFISCRATKWTTAPAATLSWTDAKHHIIFLPFRRKQELGLVCAANSNGQSSGDIIPKQLRQEIRREFPELEEKDIEEIFLDLKLESSLDIPQARAHYEIMFLIHEDNFDVVPRVTKKCQDFVTSKGGVVWRLNDWGLRRLAYRIGSARKANYILMNVELAPAALLEFDRMLGSDERIIRRLVTREKMAITESCPPPPEYDSFQLTRQDSEIAMAEAVYFDSDDDDDDSDYEDEDWEEVEEEEGEDEEEWVPISVEELKNQGQKGNKNTSQ